MAINFVKNDDIRILRDIEQYYSTQIDEMPMNGTAQPAAGLRLSWALLSRSSLTLEETTGQPLPANVALSLHSGRSDLMESGRRRTAASFLFLLYPFSVSLHW